MDKSDSENWDFLEALYKHGANVDALCAVLPTWTKSQIEHGIKRFRFRAKRKLDTDEKLSKDASLNQWVKVSEHLHQLEGTTNNPWWRKGRKKLSEVPKDHMPILSKAMMYAACFEDHYQGSAPDDPNYSEIYRYLSQLIEGSEPTQLTPGSASKVMEMLNKIKKVVTDETAINHRRYLQNLDVSYLPPVPQKLMMKGRKVKPTIGDARAEAVSPEPPCPLFQEDREDVRDGPLEPCDPYYELKKETVVKKIHTAQQDSVSNLQLIPGLNPMEIPAKFLVKPPVAIVEPQNL